MKLTLFAAALALPCLALPALAEDATTTPPKPRPAHVRVTWQERFAQANVTHDGHLTSDQAKAGYPTLFKHFAEIDTDKKGFVTVDDVTAWHKLQRASHVTTPPNPLRPHHTMHRGPSAPPAVKASTQETVPPTTTTVGPDAIQAGDTPG